MPSGWNTITSSRRLRNSGLNTRPISSFTFSEMRSKSPARSAAPKPSDLPLRDVLRAHVGRHDDDGVLEVDHAAVVVGEVTLIEHLQQDVEHIRMRLLDFVEQHHAVRLATDRLGERAGILVAHVARRRTDETRHGELLHVLAHVDANERRRIGEQELGQRRAPAPSCRHPSGPEKMNEPIGRRGSLRPARLRRIERASALMASSWPTTVLVQFLFHAQQARRFRFLQARDGNARPAADDERDLLFAKRRPV